MNTEQPQLPQFTHTDFASSGSRAPKRSMPDWMSNIVTFGLVLLVFLGFWTLIAYSIRGEPGVPTVLDIASFIQGDMAWENIFTSLLRYSVALLIGIPLGSIIGMFMGMFGWIRTLVNDSILALLALPGFAWAVLAVQWFDEDIIPSTIVAVVLTVAPFMAYTLNQGLQNMDPNLLKMSKSFRVARSEQIRHIYMSGARISFFAGLRLAVIVGFNTLLILEWFFADSSSQSGIGGEVFALYQKVQVQEVGATYAGIAAYLLIIVTLIIFLDQFVLSPLERRHYLRWASDSSFDVKTHRML